MRDVSGLLARLVLAWAATALALAAADWALDRLTISGTGRLLLAAAVYGLVNGMLKPIATFLALPLILLTFGVAYFLVNVALLWLTVQLVGGFEIRGFWTYVAATIVVWLVNRLIHQLPLPWHRRRWRWA